MPHTFTDTAGRSWSITFDRDTVDRLRGVFGIKPIDLLRGADAGIPWDTLLCWICLPQIEEAGLAKDEFFAALQSEEVGLAAGKALAGAFDLHRRQANRLAAAVAPLN